MNCSVLDLTLSQQGCVHVPEDLGRQSIPVSGGKIVVIAPPASPKDFLGCECISLDGVIVCPGFIDQHVRPTDGDREARSHTHTLEVRLPRLAETGITSVVDLLGTDGITYHPESLLAKTRALEFEGVSTWTLTGTYSLPSPTITGSIDCDMALVDKMIGVKCAASGHRSSIPDTSALVDVTAQSHVDRPLGREPGINVFHMGSSPRMLKPLYQVPDCCNVPITKLLPTRVSRAGPLFQVALEYTRRGGYIDITSNTDEPADLTTTIATALRQNVLPSRITLSSDGSGSQPEPNELGNLTGIGVAGFKSLVEAVYQLVKAHAIPLEQAPYPSTRMIVEFLVLEHKGRLMVEHDADILAFNGTLEIHRLWAKGRAVVREQRACVKGTFR